jgi:hypothetical protein
MLVNIFFLAFYAFSNAVKLKVIEVLNLILSKGSVY